MPRKSPPIERLKLTGLQLGSPQVLKAIRLVPVLRPHAPGDLRLSQRTYDEPFGVVSLEGKMEDPGLAYTSYIPHGLVMDWSDDGSPVAAFGTQVITGKAKKSKSRALSKCTRLHNHMIQRETGNRLRLLPLHMAMEGFLGMFFGGPDIAWREYSKETLAHGLSPRTETSTPGWYIDGLAEALRLFEIHQDQVGVLLFVSDMLASCFIVSHPDDYRALHRSIIEDFYGDTIAWQAWYGQAQRLVPLPDNKGPDGKPAISSVADLRRIFAALQDSWANMHSEMADDLLGREVMARSCYRTHKFNIQTFITDYQENKDRNFIGEIITSASGQVEYMKTYRLSRAQLKRIRLLAALSDHDWHIETTAAFFGQSYDEFVLRLENASLSYLLRDYVVADARRNLGRDRKKINRK